MPDHVTIPFEDGTYQLRLWAGHHSIWLVGGMQVWLNHFQIELCDVKTGKIIPLIPDKLQTNWYEAGKRHTRLFHFELSDYCDVACKIRESSSVEIHSSRRRNGLLFGQRNGLLFHWFNRQIAANECSLKIEKRR